MDCYSIAITKINLSLKYVPIGGKKTGKPLVIS